MQMDKRRKDRLINLILTYGFDMYAAGALPSDVTEEYATLLSRATELMETIEKELEND